MKMVTYDSVNLCSSLFFFPCDLLWDALFFEKVVVVYLNPQKCKAGAQVNVVYGNKDIC